MFEIRSRMAPDTTDLRRHVEPKFVVAQIKNTLKQRLVSALKSATGGLKSKQREIADSSKEQVRSAREAGKERDPAPFTGAVKSDPRPLILLAVVLAVTLIMARRMSGGKK